MRDTGQKEETQSGVNDNVTLSPDWLRNKEISPRPDRTRDQ